MIQILSNFSEIYILSFINTKELPAKINTALMYACMYVSVYVCLFEAGFQYVARAGFEFVL